MALKDIIGQENAINILQRCIANKRIPHALLFAGDEGIGKRLTAVNFAKTLNCSRVKSYESRVMSKGLFEDNPEPETWDSELETQTDACDQCPSCTKIDRGQHPDVFIIEPEGEGGQIKVSVIRELEEKLSYKPFEGNYKITIIDNADKMNQEAANAFLDTLEAPPALSILILISSRPDVLLATIRSRCQRISFMPLPLDTMSRLLHEKFKKFDPGAALLLSTLSGGRLGYAMNEDLMMQRDRSFDMLQSMLNRPEEEIRDDKISMEEWFDWVQMWLRDVAVFIVTQQADFLLNRDREDEIKTFAMTTTVKDILKLTRELYNIKEHLNFNLNEKLTLNYTSLLMRKRLRKAQPKGPSMERTNARR